MTLAPSGIRYLLHKTGDAIGRLGFRHPRTQIPVIMFVLVMAIFSAERLLIVLTMGDLFQHADRTDQFRAFLVGLRFDAVIACMAVAPLLAMIIPAPPTLMRNIWYRRFIGLTCGGIMALLILLACGDYLFFREFGHRLNYQVLEYATYDYIWAVLWEQFPLLGVLALCVGGGSIMGWLIRRFAFNRRFDVAPVWQTLLWPGLSIALVVLGIRGGVGPEPINAGPAYFSSSPAVVQLTLNGAFTLREAVVTHVARNQPIVEVHPTGPVDEAIKRARALIFEPDATPTGGPDEPMRRRVDSGRPRRDYNVVLIVMESMSWHYLGALGGDARLSPNFDRLAEQGILMERCFTVGGRTTRGMVGLVAGFPDLLGQSISTRETALGRVTTLASVLGDRGYETMFVYGGQPHYDHRQAFLGSNGYNRFVFEQDFASKTFRTHLGWCDGDLFRSAHAAFEQMDPDQPFFATLLTLSFHRDYAIPDGVIEPVDPDHPNHRQRNAVRYADHALGEFFELARQSNYFDRTIFVVVADHDGGYAADARKAVNHRVPFLIYAPAIIGDAGRRVTAVCSQTDVAPTILNLLGGTYEHGFFGSNVLSRAPSDGLALSFAHSDTLMFYEPDGTVTLIPPHPVQPRMYHLTLPDQLTAVESPTQADLRRRDRMTRDAISIIQTAERVFNRARRTEPRPVAR